MNLAKIQKWTLIENKLYRKFQFKNFREAINFLNQVAEVAEDLDHHPDFLVHYNIVEMTLWTHTAEKVTEKDFELAEKINMLIQFLV